ncbi:hypothetical protein B0A67_16025 [Flavobacterium aquidurense]|jgi:hypothetical protein|uniref:hypothetical protein n=1 Tax=Flavobacterium aquidurense TaxID=362413 RepID=UPI0009128E06|nr:hypothetical protein [Flavobacterium aquidurense]OXA70299.1 hypothetical protein B0A67_16025 [Flavobacterium aquidurense]SHH31945.1 hypothetical protein SAMN05444481_11510 [Flavobacterium frigidimaris]
MKFFKSSFSLLGLLFLTGCVGNMNPTGGNSTPNYPYFITVKPLVVKKIAVPTGTKLVYEEQFFKEGKQEKMLNEEKLITIELPKGQFIIWGGVPVTSIDKFFNSEMRGYTVYADFEKLTEDKKTKFSEMWQSCSNDIGITVKNTEDWSFNTQNISDVESCSVLYQRYFKENESQQKFLNEIYSELLKVDSK